MIHLNFVPIFITASSNSSRGIAALFFSSALWGVVKGAHNYLVNKRKLYIKNLPKSFEGLKVIQISDIHCGSFWDRKAVEREKFSCKLIS